MSETYPSDSELLNLVSDDETGVEYIETGKAPYYLEFRKLLYRLLLAAKRANDLRVFAEGGLNVGVCAGSYRDGGNLRSYNGSVGNGLADDKATIYIYLDADGVLVTDEYSAFPPVTSNHVRLAEVTTSGGAVSAIVDVRGQHVLTAFGHPVGIDALVGVESGGVHGGALACKRRASVELKALLDGNSNNLFTVKSGDRVLGVEFLVKTAAGAACVVDVGFDAAADGSVADADGWIVGADADSAGFYGSSDDGYDGIYVLGGKAAAAAGNVTVTSSSDQSASGFEGQIVIWYLPG